MNANCLIDSKHSINVRYCNCYYYCYYCEYPDLILYPHTHKHSPLNYHHGCFSSLKLYNILNLDLKKDLIYEDKGIHFDSLLHLSLSPYALKGFCFFKLPLVNVSLFCANSYMLYCAFSHSSILA